MISGIITTNYYYYNLQFILIFFFFCIQDYLPSPMFLSSAQVFKSVVGLHLCFINYR